MEQEYDLAAKLAALMEAAGGPTYEALARDIRAAGGPSVSAAYLWQLRTGARDNPTLQHLQALTRYFSTKLGIPITLSYFDPRTPVCEPWAMAPASTPGTDAGTDSAIRSDESDEENLGDRLADLGVRRISARYGRLGSDVLREVLAVMEQLDGTDGSGGSSGSSNR